MGSDVVGPPPSNSRRRNSVSIALEEWLHFAPPSEDLFVRFPNLARYFVAQRDKPRMSTNEIMERLNSVVGRGMSVASRRRGEAAIAASAENNPDCCIEDLIGQVQCLRDQVGDSRARDARMYDVLDEVRAGLREVRSNQGVVSHHRNQAGNAPSAGGSGGRGYCQNRDELAADRDPYYTHNRGDSRPRDPYAYDPYGY